MSNYTVQQGNVTATLIRISYSPVSSDVENCTPYVIEDYISADVDKELTSGEATIRHKGNTVHVIIAARNYDDEPVEEEEDGDEETEPAFSIDISPSEGSLPKLADALGLLEDYSKKQKAALLDRS